MKAGRYLYALTGVILIFTFSSCSLITGYGYIRAQPSGKAQVTFQELRESFDDYEIYWSGSMKNRPVAYLFDPKNDDRKLVPHEYWTRVKSKEEISDVIFSGRSFYDGGRYYSPEVYRIMGPDGQFYGYLYTSWEKVFDYVYLRKIDQDTLWVGYIPVPAYDHQR